MAVDERMMTGLQNHIEPPASSMNTCLSFWNATFEDHTRLLNFFLLSASSSRSRTSHNNTSLSTTLLFPQRSLSTCVSISPSFSRLLLPSLLLLRWFLRRALTSLLEDLVSHSHIARYSWKLKYRWLWCKVLTDPNEKSPTPTRSSPLVPTAATGSATMVSAALSHTSATTVSSPVHEFSGCIPNVI